MTRAVIWPMQAEVAVFIPGLERPLYGIVLTVVTATTKTASVHVSAARGEATLEVPACWVRVWHPKPKEAKK